MATVPGAVTGRRCRIIVNVEQQTLLDRVVLSDANVDAAHVVPPHLGAVIAEEKVTLLG